MNETEPISRAAAAADPVALAEGETAVASNRAGAAPPSLSHRTARGFAWMSAQSVVIKIINFAGQIALAWLLIPEDFGLAAIAAMFSIVPVLIQQGGLKEVLIQRSHFERWSSPGVWMSMTLGVIGGALMAALAWPAAALYDEPRLFGLLLIIAMLFPLDSLSIVPLARLQSQLRFKLLASIYLSQGLAQMALSILFAAMGFGPFSILLPRPIVAILTAIGCWMIAPVHVRRSPQVRRWRFLVGDSARVIVANGCGLLIHFIAYFALSIFNGASDVGLYYFAFNLSLQTLVLLTMHLGSVLFPALTTLQDDPRRQVGAALRALNVLACLAFPACLMQAVLAEPGIHAVFAARWEPSIILVQILSLGMLLRSVGWPAISLLQAQGRFTTLMRVSVASVAVHALIVTIAAWKYGTVGAAIGVMVHAIIMEPIILFTAIRHGGFGWLDLARAMLMPLALAILVAGAAALVGSVIPQWPHRHWWQIAAMVGISAAIFIPLMRWLTPAAFAEGKQRIAALIRR